MPCIFSLSKEKVVAEIKDFECISPLTKDQNYIIEIKNLICSFCTANKTLFIRQLKWGLLKYKIQNFIIIYTKYIAKE